MDEFDIKEVEATKLDPKATYLFQIDCTDMPMERVHFLAERLKDNLLKLNVKNIIIYPYSNRQGKIEPIQLEGN